MIKEHTVPSGIIPPIITPVNNYGQIDNKSTKHVMDYLITHGVNGIFALGSSGEFTQMSISQRKQVAEVMIDTAEKRVPVIINVGSTSTKESCELARHAKQSGADAIACVNPYYLKLSADYRLDHFLKVAEAGDLPVVLYNFPELTGQDLSYEWINTLIDECSLVVGIKDTVADIGHTISLIRHVKSRHPYFKVFSGYDHHLFYNLASGGDGGVMASANFIPEIVIGLYRAFINSKLEQAMVYHRKLNVVPELYALDAPFSNVIKEATKLNGVEIETHVLPPAHSLNVEKKYTLEQLLREIKTLD